MKGRNCSLGNQPSSPNLFDDAHTRSNGRGLLLLGAGLVAGGGVLLLVARGMEESWEQLSVGLSGVCCIGGRVFFIIKELQVLAFGVPGKYDMGDASGIRRRGGVAVGLRLSY